MSQFNFASDRSATKSGSLAESFSLNYTAAPISGKPESEDRQGGRFRVPCLQSDWDESPRGVSDKHWAELKKSGISDDLIFLNVSSLEGDVALEFVLGEKLGGLGGFSSQYVTAPVARLLDRFGHIEQGGWACGGAFKPDYPRQDPQRPERIIKYESRLGVPPGAFYAKISWRAGLKIARACGYRAEYRARLREASPDSLRSEDEKFWGWWGSLPNSPVLITEGTKKALCLCSSGYAAIALPGIYSGYFSKDRLGNPIPRELIPDLKAIAGHPVLLAFDSDSKPETVQKVATAINRFGALLEDQGCSIRVARWDSNLGKGADDLIVGHGVDFFESAMDEAFSLQEFKIWQSLENRLTAPAQIRGEFKDLSELSPEAIPLEGIVAIAAPKGTGKTNLIGSLTHSDSALLLGHRIALTRNLCDRLGLDYRGDLIKFQGKFANAGGYTLHLGTCVDSLLAIDADQFRECDLIIDETCQVVRHILTSSTCARDGKRPIILAQFKDLIQNAKRILLADADLDDVTLKYICELRGDGLRPFLIRSDFKAEGFPVRWVPDQNSAIAEILYDLRRGLKIFIASDSKSVIKKLERLIVDEFGASKPGLTIHSENSGAEEQQAFVRNPNGNLQDLEWVAASPSLATGVSIEIPHFDRIYGIFNGVSGTDADLAQALGRVRSKVPRIVFCADRGRAFSKIGRDTSPLKLRNVLLSRQDANSRLLRSHLGHFETPSIDWALDPHLNHWAEIEADRNRSMWGLGTALRVRLLHEGNQIQEWEPLTPDQNGDAPCYPAIKDLAKLARQKIVLGEAQGVLNAKILDWIQVAQLESELEILKPEDLQALQRYHFCEFYAIDPKSLTLDLILADQGGRRRAGVLNLENLISGELATQSDLRAIGRQAQWSAGFCAWDLSQNSLEREIRLKLGLERYLNPTLRWSNDSLSEFKAIALELRRQIKAGLNVTIREEMGASQILGILLSQLAIKTVSDRRQKEGVSVRYYSLESETWRELQEILERRKIRRETMNESCHTTLEKSVDRGYGERKNPREAGETVDRDFPGECDEYNCSVHIPTVIDFQENLPILFGSKTKIHKLDAS